LSVVYVHSYTIRTGSFLHTAGQGTEEGHRGLALDTLCVTGQRQHGKQPTASHRQHKSSTYVSRIICRRYLFVVIKLFLLILLLFWHYYFYTVKVVQSVFTRSFFCYYYFCISSNILYLLFILPVVRLVSTTFDACKNAPLLAKLKRGKLITYKYKYAHPLFFSMIQSFKIQIITFLNVP